MPDSVKPNQIVNIIDKALKRGLGHVAAGDIASAENEFQRLLEIRPGYIGTPQYVITGDYAKQGA